MKSRQKSYGSYLRLQNNIIWHKYGSFICDLLNFAPAKKSSELWQPCLCHVSLKGFWCGQVWLRLCKPKKILEHSETFKYVDRGLNGRPSTQVKWRVSIYLMLSFRFKTPGIMLSLYIMKMSNTWLIGNYAYARPWDGGSCCGLGP